MEQRQRNRLKYQGTADTADLVRIAGQLQGITLADLSIEERLPRCTAARSPATITADHDVKLSVACESQKNSERPLSQWTAREIADEVKKREIVSDISPRHAADF